MAIERVKVRANITIGRLSVSTPYIQSFNVKKQRGQVSTFDASLKVSHDEISGTITGGNVVIKAGSESSMETIFTGMCRTAKISPCYDDPKYVILSISGADASILLQGKRYTRRCRATTSTWVSITGVNREGLKSGKFSYDSEKITIDSGQLGSTTITGNLSSTPGKAVDKVKPKEIETKELVKPPQIMVQILSINKE